MTRIPHRVALWFVPVVLCALSTGCSPSAASLAGGATPLASTSGSNPTATPFSLDVLEEVNDGKRLTVRGRFVPKVEWDPSDVVVRLSALDESGEPRLSHFPVVEAMSGPKKTVLSPGESTEFTVSILSQGITNYQLELLWGADAAPFKKKETPSAGDQFLALRGLEVHRIPGENCASPDECVVRFNISGEFFNAGSATIGRVVVRAGFVPTTQPEAPSAVLENERRIEVRNLALGPGEKRPFRLTLERLVGSGEQIAPRPVVQIENVETLL